MTDKKASPFDILKSKRKTLRGAVTRDSNDANSRFAVVTAGSCMEAEAQLLKLKRHQTALNQANKEILDAGEILEADLTGELDRQQEYSDKLGAVIDRLEVMIRRVQNDASAGSSGSADSKTKVRMPKLELTSFEGDPLRWEEFWDDFTCSVDSRTDLSTIDKFKLLKQSLKGEALSVADGYFMTQRNYQQVKDALIDRFGDPQVAIFAHFEALLELSPASHEVDQLIRIRDKCEAHIRSLAALGLTEDNYGLVFAPIILSKLPRFVKMEMHRRNGSNRWTLESLRDHLKEEIRVRTKSDRAFSTKTSDGDCGKKPNDSKKGKKPPGTGSSLIIQDRKGKGPGTSKVKFKSGTQRSCLFCHGDHPTWSCKKYATAEDRVKQVKGRCYGCLSENHMKSACPSTKTCFYCQKAGHHSSLCYTQFGRPTGGDTKTPAGSSKAGTANPPTAGENIDSDSSNLVQGLNPYAAEFQPGDGNHLVQINQSGGAAKKQTGTAILESAVVPVRGRSSRKRARVVFDNGSTLSFVRKVFAKQIGAQVVGESRTMLGRFGDASREDQKHVLVTVRLQLRDGSEIALSLRQVDNVSSPLHLVPVPLDDMCAEFPTSDFAGLVDQPEAAEIDILIGLDYYYDIVGPEIWRAPNGVVIKQTAVGKVITGFVKELPTGGSSEHQMMILAAPDNRQELLDLERFWRLEEAGAVDRTDRSDDQVAVDLFNSSIRFSSGRYEVRWPFKEDPPNLPVNYEVALRRLSSVHRKLMRSPDLLSTYDEIFQDQLSKAVIEPAPEEPEGPLHYLPHHAVVIPKRETTKVRLVFDASSKPNSSFHSLNEAMYRGPVFLNDLCGLLLRMKTPTYAVTSDVEKAFLQIGIQREHRDCTRFLWLRDPTKPPSAGNLIVYRYTRVLFGATASPFLLAATIMHHLKQADTPTSRAIIESTYMDNILSGGDTTPGLVAYFQEAKQLFAEMSMNLHQWYSNNSEFLNTIPSSEKGARDKPSVLGLKWDLAKDTFSCSVGSLTDKTPSKRIVLQGIATVYDPCGWYSAVTITGKILMQTLWKQKLDWDDKLTPDLIQEWDAIKSSLIQLPDHMMPRQYSWNGKNMREMVLELHVFCDASSKAYSAVVYLRATAGASNFCDLLFAKARVAPVKELTIPKLELTAARLGSRLLLFVEKHLRLHVASRTLWTDSLCTLCWIEGNKVSTTFVQNRVKEIRAVPGLQFRHVPSCDNPADLGSRGTTFDSIVDSSLWWHGPSWLLDAEDKWPPRPQGNPTVPITEPAEVQLLVTDQVIDEKLFSLERFSSLSKLLRVTAYVRRACQRFKGDATQTGEISATEMASSLSFWEHRVQSQHFGLILADSKSTQVQNFIRQLGLFKDEEGFIRCRGRFKFSESLPEKVKFPLLLPKASCFTKLVILDCHTKVLHFGVKHTLGKLREKYWVCQGRSAVKSILVKCAVCRIHTGGSFKVPDPAPLPSFRASIKRPFAVIGLDYLGPLYVKDGAEPSKVWIALFTCAVTRAVHLEVVQSLSAADFLMALRRFVAIYSKPQLMVSDNARQFKAADQMLAKEFKRLSADDAVTNHLSTSGIEWKYIVEKAPWMGGFYERLVATVKEALKKSLGKWTIRSMELMTICYEVAFVINSRPLIYAEDDPGAHVLTPLDLLFRSTECFADGSGEEVFSDNISKADELLMHWRAGQNLLKQFWDSWKNDYLVALRERSRVHQQRGASEIPAREGVIVLIKDTVPRGQWKVGKIVKVRTSQDGLVRAAEVKLPSGSVLVRPIKLLYPIESGVDDQPDAPNTDSQHVQRDPPPASPTDDKSGAATPVQPRPKRKAAETARDLTKQILAGL